MQFWTVEMCELFFPMHVRPFSHIILLQPHYLDAPGLAMQLLKFGTRPSVNNLTTICQLQCICAKEHVGILFQIILKFPPNISRDGNDSLGQTTYIAVPVFHLLGLSQIQIQFKMWIYIL